MASRRKRTDLRSVLAGDMKRHVKFRFDTRCDNDCDRYCSAEGTCRAFRITSVEFDAVDLLAMAADAHSMLSPAGKKMRRRRENTNLLLRGYGASFEAYCLERILVVNRAHCESSWEWEAAQGYYGQELDVLRLADEVARECARLFDEVSGIDGLDGRVEWLLNLEYGRVLPQLAGLSYSIRTVPRERILYPQTRHLEKAVRGLAYQHRPAGAIMGVCVDEGGSYRVVDGYHRLSQTRSPEVTIIAANGQADKVP